ncbi:hypothetical protein Gotur_026268 [Gossypium turneri]
MRLSELGLKQRSKKRAIAWPMDMYQNCGNYSYQCDSKQFAGIEGKLGSVE